MAHCGNDTVLIVGGMNLCDVYIYIYIYMTCSNNNIVICYMCIYIYIAGVGCNVRLQDMMEEMVKGRGGSLCAMDSRY